jgi:formylglycine-generating enzyme
MFNALMVTSAATRLSVTITLGIVFAGCNGRENVQCQQNTNCDLSGAGLCVAVTTGNSWCAYPDPGCSSGYRYSHDDVGDGVSGACVAAVDAGVPVDNRVPVETGVPADGLNTCGPGGNDDCRRSLVVNGGTFYRSYVNGDFPGDRNSPATISTFRLDKYEVTVGRFRAFIAENRGTQANPPVGGVGSHANISGSGWQGMWNTSLAGDTAALVAALKCESGQTWTDAPGPNENRPMNCVTWYEAMAFCVWDGGYLPTEAEWNYAAAGGDQQRLYPWSTPPESLTIDGSHASYFDGVSCVGDGLPDCALTDMVAVGTKPAGDGRWGQSDLAGNVAEWTLDSASNYQYDAYPNPCVDCADLTPGFPRAVRGGGFYWPSIWLRAGVRYFQALGIRAGSVGMRCARAL